MKSIHASTSPSIIISLLFAFRFPCFHSALCHTERHSSTTVPETMPAPTSSLVTSPPPPPSVRSPPPPPPARSETLNKLLSSSFPSLALYMYTCDITGRGATKYVQCGRSGSNAPAAFRAPLRTVQLVSMAIVRPRPPTKHRYTPLSRSRIITQCRPRDPAVAAEPGLFLAGIGCRAGMEGVKIGRCGGCRLHYNKCQSGE